MTNYKDLVKFAESKIGTPYIYGMRGEKATRERIDELALYYPNIFNNSYRTRSYNYIGRECVDCSGLIGWKTGIQRSSQGYYDTAIEKVKYYKGMNLHNYIGWGLWRSGHIGIVVGDNECIEARGIDYGTVKSIVSNRNFEYVIKLKDIDYTNKTNEDGSKERPYHDEYGDKTYKKVGWHIDSLGVWYRFKEGEGKGTYYTSEGTDGFWVKINNVFYCFNTFGYLYAIAPEGKENIERLWRAI